MNHKWYILTHKSYPNIGYRSVADECYINPWDEIVEVAETDGECDEKLRVLYAVLDVMMS